MKLSYVEYGESEKIDVIFSDAFFDAMRRGKKIEAIKELRAAQETRYNESDRTYHSKMGLKEAKEITEKIEKLLWPDSQVSCPHCSGRGFMYKANQASPFYYPHS